MNNVKKINETLTQKRWENSIKLNIVEDQRRMIKDHKIFIYIFVS